MKYDLEQVSASRNFHGYDIAIAGAGVAGITLARKLAQHGLLVCLLEGGGETASSASQSCYDGMNIGLPNIGLQGCRLRYLGGTSNHWAGRCMTLQEIDFRERPFLGMPAWPIEKAALDIHFPEACDILDIKPADFTHPAFPGPLSSNTFYPPVHAESPPTRFRTKYGAELADNRRIDLLLNANLVDIPLMENQGQISAFRIHNYKGTAWNIQARYFVLALGAVENARILLNTQHRMPGGIGNHSDYVGRCFMEHLNVDLGRFVADYTSAYWNSGQFELFPQSDFTLRMGIGSGVIAFHPNADPPTYGHLANLKRYVRDAVCTSRDLTEFSRKLIDFDCPGDGLITTLIEQLPNRNSRIILNRDKDRFGLQRISLDWQLRDEDHRTVRTLAMEAATELARLDIARVQLPNYILDTDQELPVSEHCHHMGTTRMALRPKDGVVDPDCRIFGTDNLYVAGSSVFPTGGGVNPTFSIVQLSLRLAEHLAKRV